jgi:hypothetical protein
MLSVLRWFYEDVLFLKVLTNEKKRWVDSDIIRLVSLQTILVLIFIQIHASPIL